VFLQDVIHTIFMDVTRCFYLCSDSILPELAPATVKAHAMPLVLLLFFSFDLQPLKK
jgi:hypothetical protein